MTKTITINLSDADYQSLEYISLTPETWILNSAQARAQIAGDEIVKIATNMIISTNTSVANTSRDALIAAAFTNNWVQTAAQRSANIQTPSVTVVANTTTTNTVTSNTTSANTVI